MGFGVGFLVDDGVGFGVGFLVGTDVGGGTVQIGVGTVQMHSTPTPFPVQEPTAAVLAAQLAVTPARFVALVPVVPVHPGPSLRRK